MKGRNIVVDRGPGVDPEREADPRVEDPHHLAGIGEDLPENEDIEVEAEEDEIEPSPGPGLVIEEPGEVDLGQAAETTPVFHLTLQEGHLRLQVEQVGDQLQVEEEAVLTRATRACRCFRRWDGGEQVWGLRRVA